MLRRILAYLFLILVVIAFWQCGRRGNPSGGPKDVDPPQLLKADPADMTINFKANKIRLTFDEYIKLEDIQDQLIISPPLKYLPEITPQGGTSKFVEIKIKDTLKANTTYTLNFGQSIVDNNEGNPSSFLTYVFSTGDYIDSLTVSGVVKDAFNNKADDFISVMLYELDSAYTDSTIYQRPPNYITNTLDSTVIFTLRNLKEGKYALFGLKDAAKNNVFDQNSDKIAFLPDTISLPTDSIFLLTLFREVQDFKVSVPSYVASNKILFGYYGDGDAIEIEPLTKLPDSVRTLVLKEANKDTLNFWFTPTNLDSIVFKVINDRLKTIDTFTVKSRKVAFDSLVLTPNQRGSLSFNDPFHITGSTPLVNLDTALVAMMDKDSSAHRFNIALDSIENKVDLVFDREPNQSYTIDLLPGAITDFFGKTNDSLTYKLSTKSLADYGNLTINVVGNIKYPILVQLTDEKGKMVLEIYAKEEQIFEFNNIDPSKYLVRVIEDTNGNAKWDTGNFLKARQPEKVHYFPTTIEIRANWELNETFTLVD